MADTAESQIPARYNGKLTSYNLFDGYKEASQGGKVLYMVGVAGILLFGVGFIIPMVMELMQYNETQKTKQEAIAHNQKIEPSIDITKTKSADGKQPDLNPHVEHGDKFRTMVTGQQEARAQSTTRA